MNKKVLTPTTFLFFGRLEREKGFAYIVEAAYRCLAEPTLSVRFAIFGDGTMQAWLLARLSWFPDFYDASVLDDTAVLADRETLMTRYRVIYFGFRSRASVIDRYLESADYTLMPSLFLETFGLTALESLALGVPVISWRRGALSEFVIDGCELHDRRPDTVYRTILRLCDRHSGDARLLSGKVRKIAETYTPERWMARVRDIIPKGTRKILMVSDYRTIIGGAETHIATIIALLREQGYAVEWFGVEIGTRRIYRLAGVLLSDVNLLGAHRLSRIIAEFSPDVVWCHGVTRYLGTPVLSIIAHSHIFRIYTHHDWSTIAVSTARVYDEHHLPRDTSFRAFLIAADSLNPIMHLWTVFRYLRLRMMRPLLRRFDAHIVPSVYMTDPIARATGIEPERIHTIGHFLW